MTEAWALVKSTDLDAIAQRINTEFEASQVHAAQAVIRAARTGALLKQAKARVEYEEGYGEWKLWCDDNLPFSDRTAQLYMQLATAVPALADPEADVDQVLREQPVARELAGLSLRRAMARLAEPKRRALPPSDAAPQSTPDTRSSDPHELLWQWVRGFLPAASHDIQLEVLEAYLMRRKEYPPDADRFEDWCVAYSLGQRAKSRRR